MASRVQAGGSAVLEQLGEMELRQLAAAVDAASKVTASVRTLTASGNSQGRAASNATSTKNSSRSSSEGETKTKSKWELLAEVNEDAGSLLNVTGLRKELYAALVLGSH